MKREDEISGQIGQIGKWQIWLILPLAIKGIFTSWHILAINFLVEMPSNYFCKEDGYENFKTLQLWQNFSSVVKVKIIVRFLSINQRFFKGRKP